MANADNIVVGSNGSVYIAPVGTTLPTTEDGALNAAFVDLGYISEDGLTLSVETSTADVNAFQSLSAVRRLVTARNTSVAFTLREWSAANVVFAFGGGEVTDQGTHFQYDPPAAGDGLYERAMVIDWQDGANKVYRLVIPRGVATDAVETNITRTAAADLPITFNVLEDNGLTWYLFTDDQALNPS
jgi:hypothetical protein